jgi:hypothetical protein
MVHKQRLHYKPSSQHKQQHRHASLQPICKHLISNGIPLSEPIRAILRQEHKQSKPIGTWHKQLEHTIGTHFQPWNHSIKAIRNKPPISQPLALPTFFFFGTHFHSTKLFSSHLQSAVGTHSQHKSTNLLHHDDKPYVYHTP